MSHHRFNAIRALPLLVALMILSWTANDSLAQKSALRPAYQPRRAFHPDDQPLEGTIHIAVVGAVKKPAAYKVSRAIRFADAIQGAGGLDIDATGTVHLVRQGLPAPVQEFYQPGFTRKQDAFGQLRDGDVLIVRPQIGIRQGRDGVQQAFYQSQEEIPAQSSAFRSGQHPHTAQVINIACLGVANRPVVLPLSVENAQLEILIRDLLRLPENLLDVPNGLRVVSPSGRLVSDGRLQDGTVVVIDPRHVDQNHWRPLEAFPDALPLVQPQDAANSAFAPRTVPLMPGADTATAGLMIPGNPFVVREETKDRVSIDADAKQTPPMEPPSVTEVRPMTDEPNSKIAEAAGNDLSVQRSQGVPAVEPARFDEGKLTVIDSIFPISNESAAEAPASGPNLAGKSTSEKATDGLQTATLQAKSPVDDLAQQENIEPQKQASWSRPVTIVLTTCLLAMIGLLVSYLWSRPDRHGRKSSAIEAARKQRAPVRVEGDQNTALSRLIDNRLAFVEEEVVFHEQRRLHGPVIGRQRILIDTAHRELQRPHITISENGTSPQGSQVVSEDTEERPTAPSLSDVPEKYDRIEPEPRPRTKQAVRQPTAQGTSDLLTRVLTTLQREQS